MSGARAAVDTDADGGLELLGALVLDVDASGLLERLDHGLELDRSSSVKGPRAVTTLPANSPASARSSVLPVAGAADWLAAG